MPLVTTKEMLIAAQAGRYAVGAFNFENMEMALAIVAAAEKMNSPVILQTTLSTTAYGRMEVMAALARAAAGQAKAPVALHLDHGNDFAKLMQALHCGYSSIMIDGSKLPFRENMDISRKVAEVARPMGIPVEAELGKVGGKEDDIKSEGGDPGYTDPDEAKEFVDMTGVDSLAVGIGTAHGVYKGEPKLALDVLEKIRAKVAIPLVLHGASGLPDADVRACVRIGVSKVNYATELRQTFTGAARRFLEANPASFDPKQFGKAAMKDVTDVVCERIAVLRG